MDAHTQQSLAAIEDFRRARRRAILADLAAWLRGEPDDLLSFEEVRRLLRVESAAPRGLREIPVAAIVGSVGRYSDFTRHFLPRRRSDESRWAGVRAAMRAGRPMPPIEVYQIGAVYFVQDGNHRVSVARELGIELLPAYVTEVQSRVALTPDLSPDELIILCEQADFLERTGLDAVRPDAGLRVTAPGSFEALAAHVEAQRYRMALREGRAVSPGEAAAAWYDEVYLPTVAVIGERGLLRDFPGRTETDLYVWVAEHRAALEAALELPIAPASAARDLARRHSDRPARVLARVRDRLLDTIRPATLAPGPQPGRWRHEHRADEPAPRLFRSLLVPLSGEVTGWAALEQAAALARREGGALYGLHVVAEEGLREGAQARALCAEFARRCAEAGVPGSMAVEVGGVAEQICARARWVDLVVMHLAHPPAPQPIGRLRSGFRDLVQRCPQPVLAVPAAPTAMTRALLAYDGSRKADEALAVAAYLALRRGVALAVVTAQELGGAGPATQRRAWEYLERRGVAASYVIERGPPAEVILRAAGAQRADLIVMGGYGMRPELEIVLGSAVDHVLRASRLPVLVCR